MLLVVYSTVKTAACFYRVGAIDATLVTSDDPRHEVLDHPWPDVTVEIGLRTCQGHKDQCNVCAIDDRVISLGIST